MSSKTSKLSVLHEPNRSQLCMSKSSALVLIDRERKRHSFKASQNVIVEINKKNGTAETIQRLASFGITAFYCNLSIGSIDENRLICRTIKEIVRQPSIVVGITGRLPKIGHLCPHGKEVCLKMKRQFILTADRRFAMRGSRRAAYANCNDFLSLTKPQDIIGIGKHVQLFVVKVIHDSIVCRVKKGGRLCPNDRVYFADEPFDIDAGITTEERDDLSLAFDHEINWILVPVARSPEYAASIRKVIDADRGRHVMLLTRLSSIAVETENTAENIAHTYDGIVHRFIKGSRPPAIDDAVDENTIWPNESETRVFELCHKLKKPICVVAENNHTLPCVHRKWLKLLHYYADTFMIQCNVDSVDLECIMRNQQQLLRSFNGFVKFRSETDSSPLLFNVAMSVGQVKATAIILVTYSGRAPIILSNYRPNCKIIAITSSLSVAQKLGLYHGIKVAKIDTFARSIEANAWIVERNEMLSFGVQYGRKKRWLLEGDTVILLYRTKRGLNHGNELKIIQI